MENGKIVLVNYTGKITASNTVFETTEEKKAIEAGLFEEKKKYSALPIVVGDGEMLKGIDQALLEMKEGEEKKILLKPEQAFGERNPKLIGVVPLKEFQNRKVNPVPGMMLDLNDRVCRIQSVSGGRVRVDFNHPLAGKEIEYDIKIEKELKNQKEQIDAFFEKFFGAIPDNEKRLSIKENKIEIATDQKYSAAIGQIKKIFSDTITKNVKGIESVKFTEEFTKAGENKDKETEAQKPAEKKQQKEKAEEKTAKRKAKK
ncbi:MAG: peptidylprolyl isomerase [Candidatus ainarchaeum sp.]|nr:peptidylprolyl isomerase [Candidatus ainarchaeum sp.]